MKGCGEFTGVYGDVQRVKILFNKKDSALVQMREPAQAQLGNPFWSVLIITGSALYLRILLYDGLKNQNWVDE